MKKTALFTALLGLAQSTAHADVPLFINYQGKVADSTGLPIGASGTAAAPVAAPVNRKVIFRIYDASTGGNRLWSEEQTATISLGVFSVLLGNGINPTGTAATETRPALDTVFTPSAATSRFLEIMVDNGDNVINASDVAISPRQQITSTAFAFHAKVADGIASASDLTINPVTGTASNYGLGWYGTGRLFGSTAVDGPVLYGNAGGALGSNASGTRNMALNWDASGRVGIGAASIASTTNKLTLQGDTGTDQFTIRGTDTTKGLNIGFNTTLNQGTLQTYTGTSSYGNLVLNSAGGNVGIGTSTPTNRLTVESARQATVSSANAAAKIGGSDVYTYMGSYNSGSFATWIQSMRTGDDLAFPLVLNPNGGYVGIGTNSPTSRLHVAGGLLVDNGDLVIKGAYRIANTDSPLILAATSAQPAIFQTNNTEAMRITSAGNVGIGNNSPNAKLSIGSPIGGTTTATTVGTTVNPPTLSTSFVTGAGVLGTTVGSELLLGNFGFTAGNNESLAISAYRTQAGTGFDSWFGTTLILGMNVDVTARSGAWLSLHANSNVGIGTYLPTAKLDVNGDIKSNGKSVPVAEEKLRIVRGRISSTGATLVGAGFSAVRTSVGAYTITFSPAFANEPIVTANCYNPADGYSVNVGTGSASTVKLDTKIYGTGLLDTSINFIAIGER
jgi:hypothetical protein